MDPLVLLALVDLEGGFMEVQWDPALGPASAHCPLGAGSIAVWSRIRLPALQDAGQCAAFEKAPYTQAATGQGSPGEARWEGPSSLPGGVGSAGQEWGKWMCYEVGDGQHFQATQTQ